ncbi:hypothetical protein PanWU01x14_281400 [Parasponia andersonii]|uniref:Uncharacterized protein n=1 Tax=Parasponia andersonii TaxID=3476 RepID=A0A2P5B112_PARAD|nr:hypothetical protein PanWU01x14_281400 [Parasponia andersonii]
MESTMPKPETRPEKGDSLKDQEAKVEGDHGNSSGLIEHFLPELVSGKEDEKQEQESDKDDEKRGGLITHFIANLVSPKSPETGEFKAQSGETRNGDDSKSEEEDVGISRGGLVNNLISNLFHRNGGGKRGVEESEEKKEVDDDGRRDKKPKGEEESGGGGGGGIIEAIVSHFPTSLPDDAVPSSDEASILIHSIVRD